MHLSRRNLLAGAAVSGDRAFVITRGLVPAVVGELDLVTGRVLRNVELPTGDGARWTRSCCSLRRRTHQREGFHVVR